MKALVATDYGEPPANLRADRGSHPHSQPGQLLVRRIKAAALNPFDLKQIDGAMRRDGAGELPAQDRHGRCRPGLRRRREGDGFSDGGAVAGFFGAHPGTVAEYAVIDVGPAVSRRPDGLDAVHAAAVPESGMTALTLWRAAELGAGDSVW